jgi:hypothetical protein
MSPKEGLYDLVIEESETALIQQVNERMAHGWEPLGGRQYSSEKKMILKPLCRLWFRGNPKAKFAKQPEFGRIS